MRVCIESALVDAHFEGRISPDRETRLRAHLSECASCTAYYERRVLLATLDPSALGVEERLAVGLGLGPSTEAGETEREALVDDPSSGRASAKARLAALVAMVAAAAVLLLWILAGKRPDDGFASRGGRVSNAPFVRVFQSTKGGVPEPLVGPIRRTSELAFAYESTPDYDKLLIFGLDEHGHVYWYHPAWTDPAANPSAIPVATSAGSHPLEEAILHDLDGKTLEIHALFSRQSRNVHEIESMLGGKRAPVGPLVLPSTIDVVSSVEVLP